MNIKRINTQTSQRICSSQAVVSMAAAIKELIENSLDAHSGKIEIRLKNFGADIIEVHDDGTGISPDDFYKFTARNTTSKLKNFEDLSNLESFGFRGEALNSLCFLGDVEIHTNSLTTSIGSLLKFDQYGTVTCVSPVARQKGTTVSIRNIFHTLPVRRKQFLVNLKKEFDKALQYIMSYCLVCVGIQISCCKIDKNKQVILSTRGIGGIDENIKTVFGHNQLNGMIELVTERNINQDILDEFNLKKVVNLEKIQLSGWISRPTDVLKSNNSGKQFLYVNRRPCELPKIKKIITECYKVMNKTHTPIFIISISLPKETVDVNIEPDKRVLLLDNQLEVLAVIKASILSCFLKSGYSQEFRSMNQTLSEFVNSKLNQNSTGNLSVNIAKPLLNLNTRKHSLKSPDSVQAKCPKLQISEQEHLYCSQKIKLIQIADKSMQANFSMRYIAEIDKKTKNNFNVLNEEYKSQITSKDKETAEEELKRIFRKQYFNDLEVIGQFNKGFIIARMNQDLFIIDQHASDEKKQFEKFSNQCEMNSQPLACPQRLQISSGDEEIISENIDVFHKWGFRFEFKEAELNHRVFMIAVPRRNNLILGIEDLHEMVQILKDYGSTCMLMPSRIRTAIASNACRSAIMVGTCISHTQMDKILKHMSSLKDPWTCAHGRPTIRHLHCLVD